MRCAGSLGDLITINHRQMENEADAPPRLSPSERIWANSVISAIIIEQSDTPTLLALLRVNKVAFGLAVSQVYRSMRGPENTLKILRKVRNSVSPVRSNVASRLVTDVSDTMSSVRPRCSSLERRKHLRSQYRVSLLVAAETSLHVCPTGREEQFATAAMGGSTRVER